MTVNLVWRKSSYSAGNGECVEVAEVPSGLFVRDSKDPDGPVLSYELEAWRNFIVDVRKGSFDR